MREAGGGKKEEKQTNRGAQTEWRGGGRVK